MATRFNGPSLVLSAEDCVVLDAMLGVAVKELKRRQSAMPPMAQQIVDGINRTAEQFRASVLVEADFESTIEDPGFLTRSSEAAGELSVHEVARLSGTSPQFVCLLARKGTLRGVKSGTRGTWKLDAGSVTLWLAARKERANKAA